MKYSFSWLKELSGTKLSPEKVVENLTMHSVEVEGLEKMGAEFDNVVVGKILEIKKHPNADKLQLVLVDDGKGKLEVVCGASNIEVGQKVPLALVGAKLPGGFEIKPAEIRGVRSFGMLCAPDELGLGKDHSGILILDKNAKVGIPFSKYLGLDDSIIEIKVLPDRAHDCLSHIGIAREIAVLENKKLDYDFDGLKLPNKKSKKLRVEIKDKDLCARYIGAVMTNVEIKESPEWLKARLKASGIKAINNVVDVTNYVMLELGQPLHAFDGEKLKTTVQSGKLNILVRRAKDNERMMLLDDKEITLNHNDLLITNGESPLALAGVMGGRDSGIYDDTKTIVIEAANFNAANVRKTRTRLGIQTESSSRFEKDIDPNLAEKAMVRAIELVEHLVNGKLEGIIDVYPKKVSLWKIKLDLDYVNRLLGEIVPTKEVAKILSLLGVELKSQSSKRKTTAKSLKLKDRFIECIIPTFRVDLRTQEDLIEEIGRVWGYDKIKARPIQEENLPVAVAEQLAFEREMRKKLAGLGFDEVYNYSFYSEIDANNCGLGKKEHYELANPMNPDQTLVRVRLIPNILKNIAENLKHFREFRLFELGNAYYPEDNSVKEVRFLTIAETFSRSDKNNFFEIKGLVENLLESVGIKNAAYENISNSLFFWHPGRTAIIKLGDIILGKIGEINPVVLEKYKIKQQVIAAEFYLEELKKISEGEKIYKPIRKYPKVTRDVSLLAPVGIKVSEILNVIQEVGKELVLDVDLFDIFDKDDSTSFAFHIDFGASNRTLESVEVDDLMKKIINALEKELKVEVRK